MKKTISLMLAVIFAGGLWTVPLPVHSRAAGEWQADDGEAVKWKTVSEGGSATVTLEDGGDGRTPLSVFIDKSGEAFAGVQARLKDAIGGSGKAEKAAGLRFAVKNMEALSPDNAFTVKLGLGEKGDWTAGEGRTTGNGFPDFTKTETADVVIPFSSLPGGAAAEDIETVTLGVGGSEDASFALGGIEMLYGDSEIADPVRTEIPSAVTVRSMEFNSYQYNGAEETETSKQVETAAEKSKESDASALHVSITGEGSCENRIYSVYFPLATQKGLVNLSDPRAVSFWLYNETEQAGGILIKAGTEITDGIKVYGEDGVELEDKADNRNLDFTGFRRYEIGLTAEQFGNGELEIGFWGAEKTLSVYLSAFAFTDYARPAVGSVSLGPVNSFEFTDFGTQGVMTKLTGTNTDYSHEESGAYVGISRTESAENDFSSVYLQKFPALVAAVGVASPVSLSFYVYNAKLVTSGGLVFKFGQTEKTSVLWEDGQGGKGSDRDLNYTGLRKYTIAVTEEDLRAEEVQFGIWGTSAAELYFSDFTIYDSAPQTVESEDSVLLVEAKAENFTKLGMTANAAVTAENGALVLRAAGKTALERPLEDIFTAQDGGVSFRLKPDAAYGADAVKVYLLYDDGAGVPARCFAKSVGFGSVNEVNVEISVGDLPYFVTSSNITGLCLVFGIESNYKVALSGLTVLHEGGREKLYSHVVSGFETAEDAARWSVSKASGTEANIARVTENTRVGGGALSYRFENQLYDFGWTEIYLDIGELIEKNADKDIKGISFWIYNATYVEPGELGFWLKVAQKDNPEFEVNYSAVVTERQTSNSLGFTGWNKVEISFSADAYTEQTYYSGYSANTPREFDWTKLKFIKIGFWGTYYDGGLGYSCDTILDDLRLVSARPLEEGARQFTVTYHTNGGTLPGEAKTTYAEGETFALPTPVRSGYEFAGWYTNEELTGEPFVSVTSGMSGDLELYAAWKKAEGLPAGLIAGLCAGAGVLAIGVAVITVLVIRRKKRRKS